MQAHKVEAAAAQLLGYKRRPKIHATATFIYKEPIRRCKGKASCRLLFVQIGAKPLPAIPIRGQRFARGHEIPLHKVVSVSDGAFEDLHCLGVGGERLALSNADAMKETHHCKVAFLHRLVIDNGG